MHSGDVSTIFRVGSVPEPDILLYDFKHLMIFRHDVEESWIWYYEGFFCIVLKIFFCPFVLFLLGIFLCVFFRFVDTDYPFGTFKLSLGQGKLKSQIL
jgi:hypothetical protein